MQRNERGRPKERPLRRLKGDDAKVLKQRFHADEDEHRAAHDGCGLLEARAEKMADGWEKLMIDVLKKYPEFTPPSSFSDIKRTAERVIDRGVKMGEGWLLPGRLRTLSKKDITMLFAPSPSDVCPITLSQRVP